MKGKYLKAKETYNEEGLVPLPRITSDYLKTFLNERYHKSKSTLRYINQYARFGSATPNPYKIIWISPKNIEYMMAKRLITDVSMYGTHILDGKWDINTSTKNLIYSNKYENVFEERVLINLDKYGFYQSLLSRYSDKAAWSETVFYKWLLDNLNKIPKYYNLSKIKSRLAQIDTMYQWMNENGYKSQRQLLNTPEAPFYPAKYPLPEHHEVLINIGRDGKLIFEEGRHRFSVAKVLGINKIPVRICARHEKWQLLRQEIDQASSITELTDDARNQMEHPDMKDVIGGIMYD